LTNRTAAARTSRRFFMVFLLVELAQRRDNRRQGEASEQTDLRLRMFATRNRQEEK
jgi:hypothetical protein